MLPGGKGANQAIAARRAGAEVAMAGAVGTDLFADAALAGLIAAGVDVAWVRRDAAPTGVALIHVEARGQNAITVVPGANAQALAAHGSRRGARPADHAWSCNSKSRCRAVRDVACRARRRGARVVLNAAPAQALPPALLAALDVLIVNAIEAAALAAALDLPRTPDAFAAAMHRRHGCAVIVTLGPARRGRRGRPDPASPRRRPPSTSSTPQGPATHSSARSWPRSIDGAGWPRAIAEGVAAGSLACAGAGAQPGAAGGGGDPAARRHRWSRR